MRGGRRKGPGRRIRFTIGKLGLSLVNAGLTLSLAGGVMVVFGFVVLITIRELRTPALVLVFLGLLLLAIPLVTYFPTVRKAVTARTGRYATNTVVMIGAFLAIVVMAGFISLENSHRLDVTASRQFSLAPQTLMILKELQEPVKATGYFVPTDPRHVVLQRSTDDFFYEFSRRSSKFTYEFVDPEAYPDAARFHGVTQYPTIVFETPESQRNPYLVTPPMAEQDLVSALLIVTGTNQKWVYFTTGHGERDILNDEVDGPGFGFVRGGLLGDNYLLDTVNLTQAGGVPEDTAVLVIAGPTKNFLSEEIEIIDQYLENHGRALFLVDKVGSSNVNQLLNKWGINVPEGTIVDELRSASGDPRSPIIERNQYFPDSPITAPLDDTFFTEVSGIEDIIKRSPEGQPPNPDEMNIFLTPLAVTSLFSCITTNQNQTGCSGEDDLFGPHTIAMTVQALAPVGSDPVSLNPVDEIEQTTIVVFGDSDFVSNKFFYAFSNSDFFLNAVNWLAKEYDLISIHAKPFVFRQLVVTQGEFDFIRYSSWFLLPVGVILLAVISWWRRR